MTDRNAARSTPRRRGSEETRIGRRAVVAIVKAVDILDRACRQFLGSMSLSREFESRKKRRPWLPFRRVRRANAAYFAEMKFDRRRRFPRRRPLVARLELGQRSAVTAGWDEDEPRARLAQLEQ